MVRCNEGGSAELETMSEEARLRMSMSNVLAWSANSNDGEHSNENKIDRKEMASSSSKHKKKKQREKARQHIFDHSTPSMLTSALSMAAGLSGGLAPNAHLNLHRYHKHNEHDMVYPTRRRHGSLDECQQIRHRASSSESLRSTVSTPSLSASAKQKQKQSSPIKVVVRKYSKDDSFGGHMHDYAGMSTVMRSSKRRMSKRGRLSRASRNNSPRMTDMLFSLSNINDFVTTNEANTVVTNSFAVTHDANFQCFDNHF